MTSSNSCRPTEAAVFQTAENPSCAWVFSGLSGCLGLPEVTSVAVFWGLRNPPALFALADFHLFSVIYAALSCTEIASFAGYSAPRVHQSVGGDCLPIRPSPELSSPERGMIDKLA